MSGKLPATLGQKNTANSMAVVVASDQSTIPVSLASVPSHPVTNAGTFAVQAAQAGTWNIGNVTGTISLPTGAAADSTVSTMSGKLPATIGQKASSESMAVVVASDQSTIPVSLASVPSHPVTNAGTFAVQASQAGTWNIGNVTGTVSLPTGAATDSTISTMSGKLPATLGQKTMANSLAVVVASDQGAVPVSGTVTANAGTGNFTVTQATAANLNATVVGTGTFAVQAAQAGTWNIANVTGTVSLPTGAATSAAQTTGNTSLSNIDTKIPAQSISGLMPVDTLAALGVSRLVAMGASSTNIALTTTTRRVSIYATIAGFFAVGVGAQTASSTSHYIGAGERLDFDVAANTQIAAIRASLDGTLYISELTAT
jgi:hypothetical protein